MPDQTPAPRETSIDQTAAASPEGIAQRQAANAVLQLVLAGILTWIETKPSGLDALTGCSLAEILGQPNETDLIRQAGDIFDGGLDSFAGALEVRLHVGSGLNPNVHIFVAPNNRVELVQLHFFET